MNDKDKEAYEQWVKSKLAYAPTPEYYENLVEFKDIIEFGWQAACDYKEKQLLNGTKMKQLNDRMESLIAEIEKLQAENAKLRECAEFYANRKNWTFEEITEEDIFSSHAGKRARQCLRELAVDQVCEKKGW